MIKSFKKIILTLLTFALFLNITVCAEELFSLSLPNEFYTKPNSPKKVSEILGVSESDLNNYCIENNVYYLAVNKKNTKQIKITVNETAFSSSIINLSNLTDDKILGLTSEISGIDNINGDVVNIRGQKFLKVEFSAKDSGGEYILTQYITACDKKSVIISFYTDNSLDTEYASEIMDSISCPMFIAETNATLKAFSAAIPLATIAFILICIGLIGSIIIDLKQQRNALEDEEDEDSEEEHNTKEE